MLSFRPFLPPTPCPHPCPVGWCSPTRAFWCILANAVSLGRWPYIKLLLLFWCWMASSAQLSPDRRGTVLAWIDALGKWSLLDIFVLVMFMVAFRFNIAGEIPGVAGPVPATFDIFVRPAWGFYGFLLATVVSLVLSHIATHCHRQLQDPAELGPDASSAQAVSGHTFRSADGTPWRFSKLGVRLVAAAIVAALAAALGGLLVESFSFEFQGLAGGALESGGGGRSQRYSVLSLGLAIRPSVQEPDVGIYLIEATYFLFTAVAPILQLICLLLLWLWPMKDGAQRCGLAVAEVLTAWSCIDVLVLTLVAAVLQIQQFAAFIIGDQCTAIDDILQDWDPSLFPGGDATCFDVVARLHEGCWLLFGSAVLTDLVGWQILRLASRAVSERATKARPAALLNSETSSGPGARVAGSCSPCCMALYAIDDNGWRASSKASDISGLYASIEA